jgi:hypothetical protein
LQRYAVSSEHVTRCTVDYGSGDYEEIEHATQMTLAVSALFRVLHDKASPRASAGAPYLQFQEGVGNGALGMARATAFVLDSTNRRLLRIGADLTLRGSVQILSHIDQATRQAEPIEGCRYFFLRLTHRRSRHCTRHHGRCLHGNSEPEPTGSRRATPLLLVQHQPGHSLRACGHRIGE